MIAIGLSGKIGAGKDAIAERLVSEWGFRIVRFSDPLKEEVLLRLPKTLARLFQFNYGGYDGDPRELRKMVFETKPPGVRELLQEYGTEVRRQDDPDYWVKKWIESAERFDRVVAPDVRFHNEAHAILAASGELWRVERPGTKIGSHPSETVMDSWTHWDDVIQNDSTLEALWAIVDRNIQHTIKEAA